MTMTETELDTMFSKAEKGLNDSELKRVADCINSSTDTTQQWRGLQILGWARALEYTTLIQGFLDRTDDVGLPAIAIRSLVYWFQDARPYIDRLKCFLSGIPEDSTHSLQLAALQVAGEAYRQTFDLELLKIIIRFINGDNDNFRDAAYDSLTVALSPDWNTLTPRERYERRSPSKRAGLVEKAERLCSPELK